MTTIRTLLASLLAALGRGVSALAARVSPLRDGGSGEESR